MPGDASRLVAAGAAALLAAPVGAADGDLPSGDFLEYLGSLVEDQGEWIHPDDLEGEEEAELDYEPANAEADEAARTAEEER